MNQTISASQVTGLFGQFACPAAYYFDKIKRYPRKPKPAFDIGKAIENAVTDYHVQKQMRPEIFIRTIEQLKQGTYADRFGVPKYGYKDLSTEEKLLYDEEIAEIDYTALLTEYANSVQPLTIIESQLEIKYEIFPGVTLLCYPDLLTQEVGIIELKTSGKSWSDFDVKKKFQHIVEVMATEQELGFRPAVMYQILVKTKTPKIQFIPVEVTDTEIEQVKNLLLQAVRYKETFNFVPHERDKTNCMICGQNHSREFFFTASL